MGGKYPNVRITPGDLEWYLGKVLLHHASFSENVCTISVLQETIRILIIGKEREQNKILMCCCINVFGLNAVCHS